MFGCCNTLFPSSCGFGSCCRCGRNAPLPTPIPPLPPMPTPPSPPQLRGLQLSLVGSSAGTITHGASVPFDALNVNNTVGVGYTPSSGVINVGRAGTYLVNWWVAVENAQATDGLAFALSLNGSDVQTSYSDIGGGQIYWTAIVPVSSVPATLSLVNRSGCEVTLVTAAGQAGLTVTQIA